MLCILFGFWEWVKSSFIQPSIFWLMAGTIGTFTAALVALFKEKLLKWLDKPKISFNIIGSEIDNNNHFWHLEIINNGGFIENAAVYMIRARCNEKTIRIHQVRFKWPYENEKSNLIRPILKEQFVDLFDTVTKIFSIEPNITKLNDFYKKSSFDIGVRLIWESGMSDIYWITYERSNNNSFKIYEAKNQIDTLNH